jgi:hypothetical protein
MSIEFWWENLYERDIWRPNRRGEVFLTSKLTLHEVGLWVGGVRGGLISLCLYKENNKLRD